MDEPHRNDPDGIHADARAAKAKLDELDQHADAQKALPDLQAERAAILRDKAETAEQIAAFGPEGHHEANPERQRLVERHRALSLAQGDIDRAISAIPPVMSDKAAHVEDLRRRAG